MKRWAIALAAIACCAAACDGGGRKVRRDRDAGIKVGRKDPVVSGRQSAGEEKEPNTELAEATPLPPGHYIRGALDGETDVDTFAVTVPSAGQLRLLVTGIEGVDLMMEVRDGNGTVLARSDRGPSGTVEGVANLGVATGTYYVAVKEFVKPRKKKKAPAKKKPKKGAPAEPAVDAGPDPEARQGLSPSYELSAELAAEPPDLTELEGNDDTGTATKVLLADVAKGWIGWHGDVDLWKLALEGFSPDFCLDLEVGAIDGLALTVEVLDASGAKLLTRKGNKGGAVAVTSVVPAVGAAMPPWHFVRVSADRSNPEATYDLRFTARPRDDDEEAEPNDDVARATTLPSGGAAVRATIATGDVDRYRLEPQGEPGVLDLTVEPPGEVDVDVEVALDGEPPVATGAAAGVGAAEKLAGIAFPAARAVVITVKARGAKGKELGGEARPYRLKWTVTGAPGAIPMPPEEPSDAGTVDPTGGEYE